MSRIWYSLGARVEISDAFPDAFNLALREFWEEQNSSSESRRLIWQVCDEVTAPANANWQTVRLVEGEWTLGVLGNEFWIPNVLHAQFDREGATLSLTQEAVDRFAPVVEVVSLAFTEAHRAGGWLPLHAATVGRGNRAVAFSGVSGAGKSTATLRLRDKGYTVLSEDRTFWQAKTGQVAGLDRYLRAFDDSLKTFAPHLRPASVGCDAKGKHLLPLSQAGRAKLEAVLLFGVSDALSAAERVRAVWEMSGVPLTDLARQQTQQAVGQLLPLLSPIPVSRQTVLERVSAVLSQPLLDG
ncbi:hypothetical protein ACINK0_09700 [Deinococcus sp. VB343]|uniref:hypothetical protein n=1 Tax=Deinococcus sp. VB343 TaxID=3385567 RepID=UPI0039C9BF4E